MRPIFRKIGLGFLVSTLIAACATSPTGRRTLKLFPDQQMAAMGAAAYSETKKTTPISENSRARAYVQCVAKPMLSIVGGEWEVTLFEDEAANAFALPGGKIGVYTGLLKVAENQDQLAAVIGHEIAHVQAEHGNERVSTNFVAQTGLEVVSAIAGQYGRASQAQLMSLLGLGAQVGILLPFSRAQESESDVLGQQLMAKAGYDPREAMALWQNMASNSEGQPPEFLSTHPSHSTRIASLEQGALETLPQYRRVKRAGDQPNCTL